MESVFCWPTTSGLWLTYPLTVHWKKPDIPSQQILTANTSWLGMGAYSIS